MVPRPHDTHTHVHIRTLGGGFRANMIGNLHVTSVCTSSTKPLGTFGFNGRNVLVTFATLGVQLFDVEAQVSLQKCWVPNTTSRLTCPAIQHPHTGQFWCVENETTLCSWDSTLSSFNNATRRYPRVAWMSCPLFILCAGF